MSQANPDPEGQIEPDFFEAITKEPWPEWLLKLAERMAKTYAPELKGDDLKNRPWVFEGYAMAAQFTLSKAAEALDFSAFPDSEYLKEIEKRYQGQGILELSSPAQMLAELRQNRERTVNVELPQLYEQISTAARQPHKEALEFFQAFGDGLKRQMALNSLKRLRDSNTVQICMFVISCRLLIEEGFFKTISNLIAFYFYLRTKEGEQFSENDKKRLDAFVSQFRRICSVAKLKLSGKGRPRKEQS